MRMRKLGHGQSVMFCASPEITRDMSSLRRSNAELDVLDVLRWAIAGTCRHTKQSIPLWAIQGMRYQRQHALWLPHATEADPELTAEVAGRFLEEEAKSLEARYGQDGEHDSQGQIQLDGGIALTARPQQVEAIRTRCQQFRLTRMSHAKLEEEQERELSPENEREQQNERPPAWEALPHIVHADLFRLIRTGQLTPLSNGVQPAFRILRQTSAGQDFENDVWPDNVCTSVDFARTVRVPTNQLLDLFLRPVHWILRWSQDEQVRLLIISLFEADSLLPLIRTHQRVVLHVYAARVAFSSPSLEDLRFCPIPGPSTRCISPDNMLALNLFAGQLYLRNHADYLALCRRLGLCFRPPHSHVHVAMDGFVDPTHRADFDNNMAQICRFPQSSVAYLRSLFAMRRHGQSIERSHLGRILQGEMLSLAELE